MAFSRDGNRFAWANGSALRMVTWHDDTQSWKEFVIGERLERTTFIQFSPRGNILATWEVYAKREGVKPEDLHNLRLWCSVSGKLLHATTQRKAEGWCPQWTEDEVISEQYILVDSNPVRLIKFVWYGSTFFCHSHFFCYRCSVVSKVQIMRFCFTRQTILVKSKVD